MNYFVDFDEPKLEKFKRLKNGTQENLGEDIENLSQIWIPRYFDENSNYAISLDCPSDHPNRNHYANCQRLCSNLIKICMFDSNVGSQKTTKGQIGKNSRNWSKIEHQKMPGKKLFLHKYSQNLAKCKFIKKI